MNNQAFYDRFFPTDFWQSLDRSGFVSDEKSMFGDSDVFDWIIDTVRPETIVELGSWKGHSANYMADRCKHLGLNSRIVCVDTFLGGGEHWIMNVDSLRRRNGMPTVLDAFYGNTIARGNEDMIFPLTVDTGAGWHIMRDFGFKADLIFVDAGHHYDQVVSEVDGYLPQMTERGVMFGDDYQDESVGRAVHDMAVKYGFQVAVLARKWVFLNEALLRYVSLPGAQMRTTREGWVHS